MYRRTCVHLLNDMSRDIVHDTQLNWPVHLYRLRRAVCGTRAEAALGKDQIDLLYEIDNLETAHKAHDVEDQLGTIINIFTILFWEG